TPARSTTVRSPGTVMPASMWETAVRDTASRSASSCWVRPAFARSAAMRRPRFSESRGTCQLTSQTGRRRQRRTGVVANRALITGITGQDGSYLAELLLDRGYVVVGMGRRSSTVNFERIAHIQDRIEFVTGDLLDEVSMINILREHRPNEVYNLAAQSFVQTSWSQ